MNLGLLSRSLSLALKERKTERGTSYLEKRRMHLHFGHSLSHSNNKE